MREWTKSHRVAIGLDINGQWGRLRGWGLYWCVWRSKVCGCLNTWMCMCFSMLPWEQASNETSKNLDWNNFCESKRKPFGKTKLDPQQEVQGSPLYLTKGLSIITEDEKGGTHSQSKNAWLIKLEGKTQITLNWCSVGVTDKGFHKKEEWDQPKNASGVKASSYGYWTGYNGEVHEEESLTQAKVHFTVVLAVRMWDWEPFHSQRPQGINSYRVGLDSVLWPGCQGA